MGASATVLGASGYAGGELLRLLVRHPAITVVAAAAGANAGRRVGETLPHLSRELDLELSPVEEAAAVGDVCFSCLPHGTLPAHLPAVGAGVVIDLGDDFRSDPGWSYGLADLTHPAGPRIANPGCYPTAALLCLVPFARAGWIAGPVVVDALSGVSGAGRAPADRLLFANVSGGASAYGTVAHRHVPEIERGLAAYGGLETTVSFTPHLVPMPRGLLVTARAAIRAGAQGRDDAGALEVLRAAYGDAAFVHVTGEWPSTKAVAGTNHAVVSARVDGRTGYLVCSAAIDNLGKGAAGQAVQNANLALGLPETTGLEAVAVWP